jgi:hypothetical protein
MLRCVTRRGLARLLDVRRQWGRIRAQRGRLPLVVLLCAGLITVSAAVSAAGDEPGLRFAPGGHWVANPVLDLVFHVNGGARTVDAQAQVDGIEPGSQVVQGDTSGYVVGDSRIVQFGKSTLSVERTMPAPTGERPFVLEAAGGPYLVYREGGTVVRLGASLATIPAGGALGDPVVTPDGTLWVHRLDSGVLCRLARGTDRFSCPANAPAGSTGALTVVRDRAVFVDTTADTISRIGDDGLGKPVRLGVEAPPTVKVAPVDVGGRVAILDPDNQRLHLVDGTEGGAKPVTVPLPDGAYTTPSATKSSVVLLDKKRNVVLTYTATGEPVRTVMVPSDAGEPSLSRGGDGRVYVDGTEGRHVLVVDHGGTVGQVPVANPPQASQSPSPAGSPTTEPVLPPPPGAGGTSTGGAQNGQGSTGPARPRATTGQPQPRTTTTTTTAPAAPPPATTAPSPTRPANTRSVTVSRGATESHGSSCRAPACGRMRVVMRGFLPNTTYQVNPDSTHESYTNPGAARRTDGAGNLTFEAFHFGIVGERVWVTVDGMQSNRFLWVSG